MVATSQVSISDTKLNIDDLSGGFRRKNNLAGAVVIFVGNVRDDHPGGLSLTLECYVPLALDRIDMFIREASSRWDLLSVTIHHRTGKMVPGDEIVFVGVASAHRRDAFFAAQFLMDHLKSDAPFWKKQSSSAGSHWVVPRAVDYQDKKSWN
ncbi:MAG: molybdenum cofactor biosynthesis protein MoaE [Parvularculaceae bacterium]|nr:molybdenum cofactor biosynthesis protein MoaE [Parvularculaceae bacterium]